MTPLYRSVTRHPPPLSHVTPSLPLLLFTLYPAQLWPKSQDEKSSKKQLMQQKMQDLQLIPENSNIPTFMRTLPLALLVCGGVCCIGANRVRSHWQNHGAAKTLAAACLAYAGWQGFKAARKRSSSSDIWQRCDPLLSIAGESAVLLAIVLSFTPHAVTYGIVKVAAAAARKILAGRV